MVRKKKPASTDKGKMPFGKHRGADITVVPIRYLMWAVGIVKTKSLRKAIEDEIERRGPAHRYAYGSRDFRDMDSYDIDNFDPFNP